MRKSSGAWMIVAFLATLPARADMAPASGAFLRFSCRDRGAANPVVEVLALDGVEFNRADLERQGYKVDADGGEVRIAPAAAPWNAVVIGVRTDEQLRCQSDPYDQKRYPSYLSGVALAGGISIKKEVKVVSGCRPDGSNMAGVANWVRDEAVTVTLSGVKDLATVPLGKTQPHPFGALADCESHEIPAAAPADAYSGWMRMGEQSVPLCLEISSKIVDRYAGDPDLSQGVYTYRVARLQEDEKSCATTWELNGNSLRSCSGHFLVGLKEGLMDGEVFDTLQRFDPETGKTIVPPVGRYSLKKSLSGCR